MLFPPKTIGTWVAEVNDLLPRKVVPVVGRVAEAFFHSSNPREGRTMTSLIAAFTYDGGKGYSKRWPKAWEAAREIG
jgi:hypothetical protein